MGADGISQKRTCRKLKDITWLQERHDWPGLKAVFSVERTNSTTRKTTTETSYYIASTDASAKRLLCIAREHWNIESMHWLLDVVFTVSNVKVSRLDLNFDATICNAIATLEILQNYRNIEEINHRQMAEYMREFALNYSEDTIRKVLRHRKYKKATIAFLAAFLGYWNTKHTLQQYLSRLSAYAVPPMEEFYAST